MHQNADRSRLSKQGRAVRPRLVAAAIAVVAAAVLAVGCTGRLGVHPVRPMPVPASEQARHEALDQAGRQMYAALAAGRPERLLFDDLTLRRLLVPAAATRASALRAGLEVRLGLRREAFSAFDGAKYLGICVQGARLEPAGTTAGLKHAGWMFDRALVAGVEPSGRRIASWVEGEFLFTNEGLGAISLDRVEEPRWENSDLELAPCDMEVGLHGTQDVVGVNS